MAYDYTHGGDIYSYNGSVVDFSANINPLGMSANAKEAYYESINLCQPYPDYKSTALRNAIGEFENIAPQYIFCSCGAADIIYRLVNWKKPKRALLCAPTFSEYEEALKNTDTVIDYFHLKEENEFRMSRRILNHMNECQMMFLCNPNNPTGISIPLDLIEEIAKEAYNRNILLVIDECFHDFIDQAHETSSKNIMFRNKEQGIIILKAFTKTFAMAGLRLGYCLSPDLNLIDGLYRVGQPWSVSGVAQAVGIAALSQEQYIEKSRKLIKEQRRFLTKSLENLGAKVYPAEANYILFFLPIDNLKKQLLEENILIRDCSNYRGLKKGYYRIAVKGAEDNSLLIRAMEKVLRA